MNIFERVARRDAAQPDPDGRCRLDDLEIQTIGYMGGGAIDQSSSAAMVSATVAAIAGAAAASTGNARAYLAQLLNPVTLKRMADTPPDAPEQGVLPGSYRIATAGICMGPVAPDGVVIELDPGAPVSPGDLCAFVSSFAFSLKTAMYLGRLPFHEGPEYQRQPDSFHLFFQRDPLCLLAVADFDLVSMHKVAALGTGEERREPMEWGFDVRRHPDLAQHFAVIAEEPFAPTDPRPLSLVCHEQLQAYFLRLEEICRREQGL